MTWMLIWLNWNVATINAILQYLDIYIYIVKYIELFEFNYSHAPQCFSKLENLTKFYIYIYIYITICKCLTS